MKLSRLSLQSHDILSDQALALNRGRLRPADLALLHFAFDDFPHTGMAELLRARTG